MKVSRTSLLGALVVGLLAAAPAVQAQNRGQNPGRPAAKPERTQPSRDQGAGGARPVRQDAVRPAPQRPQAGRPEGQDPQRPAPQRPEAGRPQAQDPARPAPQRPEAGRPQRPEAGRTQDQDPSRPVNERPVGYRPAPERPTAERPTAERPGAVRPAPERPGAVRPGGQDPVRPAPQRPAAGVGLSEAQMLRMALEAEKEHRERLAKINRLRHIARARGQEDKLAQLDILEEREDLRYRSLLQSAKASVGEESFNKIMGKLQTGRGPGSVGDAGAPVRPGAGTPQRPTGTPERPTGTPERPTGTPERPAGTRPANERP